MLPLSDRDLVRRRRPIVNTTLIALNLAVFVMELALGPTGRTELLYRFGMIPAELVRGVDYTTLRLGTHVVDIATPFSNWLTLITSTFLHGGWLHILGNMLYLWVFGDNIEDRFGHFRYLLFYLAAGIAANGLHLAFNLQSQVPAIGASGSIAGVLGAYIVLFPRSRVHTLVFFFIITVVRIPALLLLGVWFIMQLFSGVASLGVEATGVAYWAHVGGFALGALVAALYKLAVREPLWPRQPRPPVYWRGRRM